MPTVEAVLGRARRAGESGRWELARRLFRKAAVETSPLPRDRARAADAIRWCSIAAMRLGDWKEAAEDADRSLSMSTALADVRREAMSLIVNGAIQFERGDWTAALELYERARVVARPLNDRLLRAKIDNNEGALWAARGVNARARRLYASALAGFRAAGEELLAVRVMNNLGLLLIDEGAPRQALDWFEQALATARATKDADLLLTILTNLTRAAAESDRMSRARSAADEAIHLAHGMECRPAEADLYCALATLARMDRQWSKAELWIRAALDASGEGRHPLAEADAWEQLARVRLEEGRTEDGLAALARARDRYRVLGAKAALVRLCGLGSMLAMEEA